MAGENQNTGEDQVIFGEVTDRDMFFGDELPVIPDVVEDKKKPGAQGGGDDTGGGGDDTDTGGGEDTGGGDDTGGGTDLLDDLELEGDLAVGDDDTGGDDTGGGTDDDLDYTSVAKHLIATGEWMDIDLPEGETLENLTKEEFSQIKKQQDKAKLESAKESIYSKVSDEEKEFLEFLNNGGTKDQYLETYLVKQQAQRLDISTEVGQKNATYAYYKNFVGWDDSRIQKHMSGLSEDELKAEAQLAKTKIDEVASQRHQARVDAIKERQEAREKAKVEYKEAVKTELKESGLDVKETNTILKALTEEDKRNYTPVDIAYLKMKNDPKKVADLYRFLTDYETFVKEVSQKTVNDEKLRDFAKLKFKRKTGDNTSVSQDKRKKGEGIFITLD